MFSRQIAKFYNCLKMLLDSEFNYAIKWLKLKIIIYSTELKSHYYCVVKLRMKYDRPVNKI